MQALTTAGPASHASSPSMQALTTAPCPFPTGEAHAAADPASLASAMHMQNEMRHALVAQHARVIDLFRQWDTNGDGASESGSFGRPWPPSGTTCRRTCATLMSSDEH
jgi:hypothetical protein